MDGLHNQEVAREHKGDKLSFAHVVGGEKNLQANPKDSGHLGANVDLPKVEFVISRGQNESVYMSDGSVQSKHIDKKVDPNCMNGVRSAEGSEQRFDRSGLCKLTGNVHWGKSTADGVMEISLDGGKVKMQLDRNWHLRSVSGEHSSLQFKR